MSVKAICDKQSPVSLDYNDYEAAKILNEIKMMSDRNTPSPIVEKTIKKRKEISHSQSKTVESTIKLKDSVFACFYPISSVVSYGRKSGEIVSAPKNGKIDIAFKNGETRSISVADLNPKIKKGDRVLFLDLGDPQLRHLTAVIENIARGSIGVICEGFGWAPVKIARNSNMLAKIIPIQPNDQLKNISSEEVEWTINETEKHAGMMYDLLEREAPAKRCKVPNIPLLDLCRA